MLQQDLGPLDMQKLMFWGGKTTNLIKATLIIYTSEHLTAGTQIFGGLEDEQP